MKKLVLMHCSSWRKLTHMTVHYLNANNPNRTLAMLPKGGDQEVTTL